MIRNIHSKVIETVKEIVIDMNIGDVSGCLEIVGDCDEVEIDLKTTIMEWAAQEWNKFSTWHRYAYGGSFKNYYELNQTESDIYDGQEAMPESFVSKFREKGEGNLSYDNHFLYHKKNPNTYVELMNGYKNGELYKVKCKICNRIFYMDSESFNCVKWRSCIGAECLSNTVDEQDTDYANSLYHWTTNENEIQVLDYQLSKVEELSTPLTYYGLSESLHIAYISDVHLLHHLKYYNNNVKKMIRDVVDKLYSSMRSADIIIFGGDISSNTKMTIAFYTCFMRTYDFRFFKKFKDELVNLKRLKRMLSCNSESKYVKYRDKINVYIEKRKKALLDSFDFSRFEFYKKSYRSNESYESAFECYKLVESYKKYNVSEYIEEQIHQLARLIDVRDKYDAMIDRFELARNNIQHSIEVFEERYSKPIEDISLSDYRHVSLNGVYAVLGNHEYIDFPDVSSCVSFYNVELSKLGITLLHNNYRINDKFLIFGGTGFAKYDENWNANSVVCCSDFTREDEIKETSLFESAYKQAFNYARENGLCFLCVSHYPISSCLNNVFDKETIYFTGHNHRNKFVKTSDKVLYADNQIGYKDNNITFRIATTGYETNPYECLNDGVYKTSIVDYLQFYRYIGEDVGKGNILYQRCQYGKASLYVLKRKGYYGFFIITPKGNTKGISIVNGGVTKKLTSSTDMVWICENFDVVLSKYLQVLMPLRNAQEQLSKELQELGFSGKIHGCIVDIDFFHHIMINPIDGSMTFYYSPSFGIVFNLNSFKDVIRSLEIKQFYYCSLDYKMIQKEYDEKAKKGGYLLAMISSNYKLEAKERGNIDPSTIEAQIVSRKEGMYGISRKVNPLQRLFSGHVLRDFDLRLTETKQQSYRKYLYTNRLFVYEGIEYKVIEDDGSDIIIAEEVQGNVDINDNENMLTCRTRKFAISALKSKIANKNEDDSYWITT